MKLKKGNGDKKESKLFPKTGMEKFERTAKESRDKLIESGKHGGGGVPFQEGSQYHKRLLAIMNQKSTYNFDGRKVNVGYIPDFTFGDGEKFVNFFRNPSNKKAKTMNWEQLYRDKFKDSAPFAQGVESKKLKKLGEFFKKETARLRTKGNPLKNK